MSEISTARRTTGMLVDMPLIETEKELIDAINAQLRDSIRSHCSAPNSSISAIPVENLQPIFPITIPRADLVAVAHKLDKLNIRRILCSAFGVSLEMMEAAKPLGLLRP